MSIPLNVITTCTSDTPIGEVLLALTSEADRQCRRSNRTTKADDGATYELVEPPVIYADIENRPLIWVQLTVNTYDAEADRDS